MRPPSKRSRSGSNRLRPIVVVNASRTRVPKDAPAAAAVPVARLARSVAPSDARSKASLARSTPAAPASIAPARVKRVTERSSTHEERDAQDRSRDGEVYERFLPHRRCGAEEHTGGERAARIPLRASITSSTTTTPHSINAEPDRVFPEVQGIDRHWTRQAEHPEGRPSRSTAEPSRRCTRPRRR